MSLGIGSSWQRWDAHLHTPGTLLNDQFKGDWGGYIHAIETADPMPTAIGITDYCTLRGYKEVVERRKAGALQCVQFVFANIELRLTIDTKRGKGINLHLIVSPDDCDHISLMEKYLARLRFEYDGKHYQCTDDELRRLGRAYKRDSNLNAETALREGANQFKATLSEVRDLFNDKWIRENVFVAIASGEDGLSGLSEDSGFHAHRLELGRFAHIIFSGNPNDRLYWSGDTGKLAEDGLEPRPCIHGSDAHCVADVLKSSLSPQNGEPRHCWIKSNATFDGLRQIVAEPDRRVHIGSAPPPEPSQSETIDELAVSNADWFASSEMRFNSGLVTIIGSKGSGKTALLELLAIATGANDAQPGPASFVGKAGHLVADTALRVNWKDGDSNSTIVGESNDSESRVRYLSQQFVETLCSASNTGSGHDEPLQREIESVVFDAIPEEDRLLCSSFAELRDARVEGSLRREQSESGNIAEMTRQIAEQNDLLRSAKVIKAKVVEAERMLNALQADIAKIPLKAGGEIVKTYTEVGSQLSALREAIAGAQRREQSVRDLIAEMRRRMNNSHAEWNALRMRYSGLLSDEQWQLLQFKPDDNIDREMQKVLDEARSRVDELRLRGIAGTSKVDGLLELEDRYKKLTAALGFDQANARKRGEMEKRLGPAKQLLASAKDDDARAESASDRRKHLSNLRSECYGRVFEAFDEHVDSLRALYQALQRRLASDQRLQKLGLSVKRVADLESWAQRGELLFDLRSGPFAGIGELKRQAEEALLAAWESGSPTEVRAAMDTFAPIVASQKRATDVSPLEVGDWLFSTSHINVRYGIEYEGLSLNLLSPGTRGVVLLTLYLALDEWDQRPLLIDQPEENLDPRSIYDDLVPFFREASLRRQVIMVTHNANLVVNTDSDQIIIAEAVRLSPAELPIFTYRSGGLEDAAIRSDVCRLLEGGAEAFERRRRRYGHEA